MTCDDYLAMLETLPVEELTYGSAREHAAQCHDCNRVTRVIAERERNMVLALGDVQSFAAPPNVAREAVEIARRRRVASYYRVALAAIAAAAVVVMALSRTVTPAAPAKTLIRESFHLQCLSPDQAFAILRSSGVGGAIRAYSNSPVAIVSVELTREELDRAREVLARYDNPVASSCSARVVVPKIAP